MSDSFASVSDSLTAPAREAFSISPNDSSDLSTSTKAIYVGLGGNITLRTVGSAEDVTFVNVASGTTLDIRCRAIRSTGTSAANIVGLA